MSAPTDAACGEVFWGCNRLCRPGWCPCLDVGGDSDDDIEDDPEEELVEGRAMVDVIADLSLYEEPQGGGGR